MRTLLIIAAALSVPACASNGPPGPPGAHFAALSEACSKRGGALVPSFRGGANGGYTCSGGAGADARYLSPLTEVR